MAEELSIDLNKKLISPSIIQLLETKMADQNEKDWIQAVFKGAVLKKADANQLVRSLLSALEIHTLNPEEGMEGDESLSQALKQAMKTKADEENGTEPKQGQSGLNKNLLPKSNQGEKAPPRKDDTAANEHSDKKKILCRFYKNGKCLKGAECRFDHPPTCKNFRKNGIKSHNDLGCEAKCKSYHPNACRDSLREKKCSRKD